MVYLGREIWLLKTENWPGAVYLVSGRKPKSKQRESVHYREERRVAIEPLDKSQERDPLRHYPNAIMYENNLLVVSNGEHTEEIFNLHYKTSTALEGILKKWGPEPDEFRTPRIAGIVEVKGEKDFRYSFGIVVEGKNKEIIAKSIEVTPRFLTAYGISTYSGRGENLESFDINRLIQHKLPKERIEGESAEDVLEFFVRKKIDPKFFVCGAAALWKEKEWEIDTFRMESIAALNLE